MIDFCNLHQRIACTLCDECGHEQAEHLNGHAEQPAVAEFIFANATCWAENICKACDPELHNDALVRGLGTVVA